MDVRVNKNSLSLISCRKSLLFSKPFDHIILYIRSFMMMGRRKTLMPSDIT